MSKKTQKDTIIKAEPKEIHAFTLVPKEGGYSVVETIFDSNGQVISTTEVHPSDVLPIALSKMNQEMRKRLGV